MLVEADGDAAATTTVRRCEAGEIVDDFGVVRGVKFVAAGAETPMVPKVNTMVPAGVISMT